MALAENTFDIAVMDFIVYPNLFVSLGLKASGSKKEIGQTSSFFLTQGYIFWANQSKNLKGVTLASKPCSWPLNLGASLLYQGILGK